MLRRAEEADHPEEQRAGGQPQLQAAAARLGGRHFPKKSPEPFPLRLCLKYCTVWGLHTIQWPWSQTLPLYHITDHSSREQLYSGSWETKRKSNGQSDTHHLLNTVFWYSPASAARCRSRTLTEEDYFKI